METSVSEDATHGAGAELHGQAGKMQSMDGPNHLRPDTGMTWMLQTARDTALETAGTIRRL